MPKKNYRFSHNIEHKDEILGNLCFDTKEFAARAARAVVDLMIEEKAFLNKEAYDPEGFKLHARPMRSIPSNVRTKWAPSAPPHPAEEAPAAPAKAKRVRKAKAEA